jgi:hypothetical protein
MADMFKHTIIYLVSIFFIGILFGCSWFTLSHSNTVDPENDSYKAPTPSPNPACIQLREGSTIYLYGDDFDFGSVPFGSSKTVTFYIDNIGGSVLNVTEFDSTTSADWWIVNNMELPLTVNYNIQPSQSQSFSLKFVPDRSNYSFNSGFSIWSNDATYEEFSIGVNGSSPP